MKDKQVTLILNNIVPRVEQLRFKTPISWEIKPRENWVVLGPNGAGKSLLIDILTEKYALHHSCKIECTNELGKSFSVREIVKYIAFKDIYNIIDRTDSYYQQRWNKGIEHNETKVRDLLSDEEYTDINSLSSCFDLNYLLDKGVSCLSSGELRKFFIIRSVLCKPQILILDNPYIGLDVESRKVLDVLFKEFISKGIRLILLLADPADVPSCISHILTVKDKEITGRYTYDQFMSDNSAYLQLFDSKLVNFHDVTYDITALPVNYKHAAILKNITIKYDDRLILNNLNWEIKKGDKWALLGKNGTGKSTLLSLLCGDNPQAYANDITLFDKKRGTGESIWDIKKQIGYISPEMHLYYLKNVSCIDVVGSGLFDTVGLYRKCNEVQLTQAQKWMYLFGVEHLAHSSFLTVSTGEQRLVLLARTFVKNPNLIILDEPMHGLDVENKKQVKDIIEKFCDSSKTLIFVTHYSDEIPSIVNQILELRKN